LRRLKLIDGVWRLGHGFSGGCGDNESESLQGIEQTLADDGRFELLHSTGWSTKLWYMGFVGACARLAHRVIRLRKVQRVWYRARETFKAKSRFGVS
jgi:hypothetical protein